MTGLVTGLPLKVQIINEKKSDWSGDWSLFKVQIINEKSDWSGDWSLFEVPLRTENRSD